MRGIVLFSFLMLFGAEKSDAYFGARLNLANTNQNASLDIVGPYTIQDGYYLISAGSTLGVDIEDSYLLNDEEPIVHVGVEFCDNKTNSWSIYYDGADGTNTMVVYPDNDGVWEFFTLNITNAFFAGRLSSGADFQIQAGDKSMGVRQIVVWCRKDNVGEVSIDGNQFELNGERFVLSGSSWQPPWITSRTLNEQWWNEMYDSDVVESELRSMEVAGCNLVRIHAHFQDFLFPSQGAVDYQMIDNIRDFYARAEAHGLKVKMSTGGRPVWLRKIVKNSVFGGEMNENELWMNDCFLRQYADHLVLFFNEAELWEYDSFFAIDLLSEPKFAERDDVNGTGAVDDDFFVSLNGGPLSSGTNTIFYSDAAFVSWNRWVQSTYGSADRAYEYWDYCNTNDTSEWVSPPTLNQILTNGVWSVKVQDYYDFLWFRVNRAVKFIRQELESRCEGRRPYVTVDYTSNICGDSMSDSDTQRTAAGLSFDCHRGNYEVDFASLHIYSGQSDDSGWYDQFLMRLHSLSSDKPATLAEFGWNSVDPVTAQNLENQQSVLWENMFRIGTKAGLDGIHGWCWTDTPEVEEIDIPTIRQKSFGLRTADGQMKQAYESFVQMKTASLLADEPELNLCAIWVDRDQFHVPLESYFPPWRNFISELPYHIKFPVVLDPAVDTTALTNMYFFPDGTNSMAEGRSLYNEYVSNISTDILWKTGTVQPLDCKIIDVDMPSVVTARQYLVSTVVFENTGSSNWVPGQVDLLMTIANENNILSKTVSINQTVFPGQQVTQAIGKIVFSNDYEMIPLRVRVEFQNHSSAEAFGNYYEQDVSLEPIPWTQLTVDDFEVEWGNWVDGGEDAIRTGVYAKDSVCVKLQDNSGEDSSIYLTNVLDLTGYQQLRVECTYMPIHMETGEEFRVQFSNNGGAGWINAFIYESGTDFYNGFREYPDLLLESDQYSFSSAVKIRFICNASDDDDHIFLDNIKISAR